MIDRSERLLLCKTVAMAVTLGVALNLLLGNSDAFELLGTSISAVFIACVVVVSVSRRKNSEGS